MTAVTQPVYRFDQAEHRYYIDDVEVPHITQMLTDTGWSNDDWCPDEARVRGSAVHQLAAEYDLGAITDPGAVESVYKGWFLAYVEAMRLIRPTWTHVETFIISPVHRFGGRLDRVGKLWGAWAVVDLKTGVPSRATPIQLALQCLLVAPELHLPPTALMRYELALKENGAWTLIEHRSKNDFNVAMDVIRECCR